MSDLFSGDVNSDTSLEELIVEAIVRGRSEAVTATIVRNHTVCLSVGDRRGTFSSISVLVNYTCSGSAQCPSSAVEQFNFGCSSGGRWTRLQAGTSAFARDVTPLANFQTDERRDCRICFVQVTTPDEEYDDVTHCHCKSHVSYNSIAFYYAL